MTRLRRLALRGRHPSSFVVPTEQFAHESEHYLARVLTVLGRQWSYEPDEFPLAEDDHGHVTLAFRPDFYLPDFDCYVELTVLRQALVTKKNRKVRLFRERYPDRKLVVLYQRNFEALRSQCEQLPTRKAA